MVRILTITIIIVALTSSSVTAGSYFVKRPEVDASSAAPTGDTALVYWMRLTSYGAAVKSWSFVDDNVVGVTKDKGYFFANVPAGRHIFWAKAGSTSVIEMEVVAGRTYYFEHDIWMGGQVKLAVLTDEQAHDTLAQCTYVEITEEGRRRGAEIAAARFVGVQAEAAGQTIPVATSPVPDDTTGLVLVRAGTAVEVELMENLSSRHTTEGEEILFRTTNDVEISDNLTVPAGRLVRGVVHRVDRASGGGDAGEVDVVVPALVTRDGIEIPVIGRVIVEGRDAHGKAGGMGIAFGLIGRGLTKGKAAYVLAGERYSLIVRDDTWVPDRRDVEKEEAARRAEEAAVEQALPAQGCEITFKPESRKSLKDIVVCIETAQPLAEASLTAVGALQLLDPVRPSEIRRRKGGRWAVSLPGWSVLRYVRPEQRSSFEVPLRVTGALEDGTRITATSVLTVVIVEQDHG